MVLQLRTERLLNGRHAEESSVPPIPERRGSSGLLVFAGLATMFGRRYLPVASFGQPLQPLLISGGLAPLNRNMPVGKKRAAPRRRISLRLAGGRNLRIVSYRRSRFPFQVPLYVYPKAPEWTVAFARPDTGFKMTGTLAGADFGRNAMLGKPCKWQPRESHRGRGAERKGHLGMLHGLR